MAHIRTVLQVNNKQVPDETSPSHPPESLPASRSSPIMMNSPLALINSAPLIPRSALHVRPVHAHPPHLALLGSTRMAPRIEHLCPPTPFTWYCGARYALVGGHLTVLGAARCLAPCMPHASPHIACPLLPAPHHPMTVRPGQP